MATEGLLLHPKTLSAVQTYLRAPTQVLALVGPAGAGKNHLARKLASELLSKPDLSNESRLILVERDSDKKEIAIGSVRELIKSLRVKQPGEGSRVVFIDEADTLSPEAQNALLKTLEQPNPDTLFILTVKDASRLLPTVFSRTQKLVLHPVDQAQAQDFFREKYPQADIERAWLLSEGQAGALAQLLENDEQQSLGSSIEAAKLFLSSPRYERLLGVDALSKEREQVASLLTGLARILKSLHHANIRNHKHNAALKLLNARKLVGESQERLKANSSAKVVLLKLILKLRV